MIRRLERTRVRNPQFVSFLAAQGFHRLPPRRREHAMRWRRAIFQAVVAALALGAAWVVVESAQAFSLF